MKDADIKEINRVIVAVNQVERVCDESDMELYDRLTMIYTAVQIIKDAISNIIQSTEESNEIGFRSRSKEDN